MLKISTKFPVPPETDASAISYNKYDQSLFCLHPFFPSVEMIVEIQDNILLDRIKILILKKCFFRHVIIDPNLDVYQ